MKKYNIKMKKTKKRRKNTWNIKCAFCIFPSLFGTAVFFVLPYCRVVYYSLINNQFQKKFVGWKNYLETLQNDYFLLAFRNSVLLICIGVPFLLLLSILLSLLLWRSRAVRRGRFSCIRDRVVGSMFFLPIVIPTAAAALVWQKFFGQMDSPVPIYLLFLWKNTGLCVLLLTAAFSSVEEEILEAAKLDGAGFFRLHAGITVPVVMPVIVFTALLSIVNSFRVFKESYLYYGDHYPPDHSYTLQYYMNNNFLKLDYQALSSSAVITSVFVGFLVAVCLKLQKKCQC